MHILLAALSILGGLAFWWYRLKYLGSAASEAVDTVGRIRGQFRRKKLVKMAEQSPITAIDDPVIAAATILVAIFAEDGPMSPRQVVDIAETLEQICDPAARDEAMIYASWATEQVTDVPLVIDRAGKFLASKLSTAEIDQFLAMADEIAERREEPLPQFYKLRVRRLRQKLGLPID